MPSAYELRFAHGKIDRVDTCLDDGNIYVKITDYKTGRKAFDVVALYHGLQLQLMVYMNAAMELEKKNHPEAEVIPAGVFYYRLDDPFIEKKDRENVEDAILKHLRPDGLISENEKVLEHLDHTEHKESLVVPIKYNKDGSLAKSSKTVSEADFHLMMNHALLKVQEVSGEILEGKTAAAPYRRGDETGCDYCKYKHICGFDIKVPGYEYRDIDTMKLEDVLKEMRKEGEQ